MDLRFFFTIFVASTRVMSYPYHSLQDSYDPVADYTTQNRDGAQSKSYPPEDNAYDYGNGAADEEFEGTVRPFSIQDGESTQNSDNESQPENIDFVPQQSDIISASNQFEDARQEVTRCEQRGIDLRFVKSQIQTIIDEQEANVCQTSNKNIHLLPECTNTCTAVLTGRQTVLETTIDTQEAETIVANGVNAQLSELYSKNNNHFTNIITIKNIDPSHINTTIGGKTSFKYRIIESKLDYSDFVGINVDTEITTSFLEVSASASFNNKNINTDENIYVAMKFERNTYCDRLKIFDPDMSRLIGWTDVYRIKSSGIVSGVCMGFKISLLFHQKITGNKKEQQANLESQIKSRTIFYDMRMDLDVQYKKDTSSSLKDVLVDIEMNCPLGNLNLPVNVNDVDPFIKDVFEYTSKNSGCPLYYEVTNRTLVCYYHDKDCDEYHVMALPIAVKLVVKKIKQTIMTDRDFYKQSKAKVEGHKHCFALQLQESMDSHIIEFEQNVTTFWNWWYEKFSNSAWVDDSSFINDLQNFHKDNNMSLTTVRQQFEDRYHYVLAVADLYTKYQKNNAECLKFSNVARYRNSLFQLYDDKIFLQFLIESEFDVHGSVQHAQCLQLIRLFSRFENIKIIIIATNIKISTMQIFVKGVEVVTDLRAELWHLWTWAQSSGERGYTNSHLTPVELRIIQGDLKEFVNILRRIKLPDGFGI